MIKIEREFDHEKVKDEIYHGQCDNCGIKFSCSHKDLSSRSGYWAGDEFRIMAWLPCPRCGLQRIMRRRDAIADAFIFGLIAAALVLIIALTIGLIASSFR